MKNIRIHYLQHVSFEGLGYIETWANNNNHILNGTKFFEEFYFPEINDFDWLIIMGGPMGVNDEEEYPWLKQEKDFILNAIKSQKVVLGICLGAQLIASALGSNVFSMKKKEIGWFPVKKTSAGKMNKLISNLPDEFFTFHWHGDTLDLPLKFTTHLLKNQACTNQAFLYNDKVLGFQFHLEATPQSILSIIDNCRMEIVSEKFIQNENEILKQLHLCNASNEYLQKILDRIAHDY